MKRKDKCKAKTTGSIMVSAILAIFVWIGIAQSMAIIANSGFKSIKSGRTAIQAQQYADISIDRLKNINYDELDTAGAHTRAVISGLSTTDWEDEVTIGAESTIAGSDDVKQRIATVNVYKTGDTLPRYTVEVPLSSQGNNTNIITYSGWIQDGDEIPLPIGVKESDCEWFVTPAMRSVDDNDAIMCFTTTRDGYIDFTSRPDNNYYSYQTNSLSKWRYKNFYPRGRVVVNRTAQRGPRLAFYMLFVGIKNKGYSY